MKISSEFTDDYDVRLKSEHKIFKFLKVLVKRSIAYIKLYAYLITSSLDMFIAQQYSL